MTKCKWKMSIYHKDPLAEGLTNELDTFSTPELFTEEAIKDSIPNLKKDESDYTGVPEEELIIAYAPIEGTEVEFDPYENAVDVHTFNEYGRKIFRKIDKTTINYNDNGWITFTNYDGVEYRLNSSKVLIIRTVKHKEETNEGKSV